MTSTIFKKRSADSKKQLCNELALELAVSAKNLRKGFHGEENITTPITVFGHRAEPYTYDAPFGFNGEFNPEKFLESEYMSDDELKNFACAHQVTTNAFWMLASLGNDVQPSSNEELCSFILDALSNRPLQLKFNCDDYSLLNKIMKMLQELCFHLGNKNNETLGNVVNFYQYFKEHGVPFETEDDVMDAQVDGKFDQVVNTMSDENQKAYAISLIECPLTPAGVPQTQFHTCSGTLKLSMAPNGYICATLATEISATPY